MPVGGAGVSGQSARPRAGISQDAMCLTLAGPHPPAQHTPAPASWRDLCAWPCCPLGLDRGLSSWWHLPLQSWVHPWITLFLRFCPLPCIRHPQEKDAAFQSLGPGCLYLQDAGSRTGTLERWRGNGTAPRSACTLSSAGQEAGAGQASACSRGSSARTPPCASLCPGLRLGAGRDRNQGPDLQVVGVTQRVCGPQREVPGSVWHRSHSGPSQSAARGLPELCPGAEGGHQAVQSQVPGQRPPPTLGPGTRLLQLPAINGEVPHARGSAPTQSQLFRRTHCVPGTKSTAKTKGSGRVPPLGPQTSWKARTDKRGSAVHTWSLP
ncbi:uncharacterized protein LOC130682792 [Manis pentadactyla]|uniref:uncharacterized protein LOC130682792 n=1 Tax=Manis pentadactyla TaxID=143292 RepID=UPI00255C7EE8|nr:uncharacterized protein LOC130682792 [Manis pentadactyla]